MRIRRGTAAALVAPLAVLGLIGAAGTASAATATVPMGGEFLSSLPPAQTLTGTCNPDGSGSLTFAVSGPAAGPYTGTFTETGSASWGPLDSLGRSALLSFSADFTITSPYGTVTGSKWLPDGAGEPADSGNAATCFTAYDGAVAQIVTSRLAYTASTPTGDDSGSSFVNMNAYPNPVANSTSNQFREGFSSPNAAAPQCSNGVDDDGDGLVDYPADPGCTSPADTTESPNPAPPGPASVTLTPPDAVNTVGTDHTVTATVDDSAGAPVSGSTVLFSVQGSSTASGSCTTGADGQCSFTYSGPALPGADTITGCADANGNAAVDPGEPCGTATKAWMLPATTPGQVTGGGQVWNLAHTDKVAFGFTAKSDSTGVKGECSVVDPSAAVKIRCLDVTTLVVAGTHATFFGNATVNGVATTYRIDVDDNGEPGRTDTFTVQTASGYTAGGVLAAGNIQIH